MGTYRKVNWPEILEQYRTGNQKVEDFCREKGIHPNSFYRNRKKYQETELVRIPIKSKDQSLSHPLELHVHDFVLKIPKNIDPETLETTLRILKGIL